MIYDTYFVCNETYEIEMGPIPEEECPECRIPEGTKCNGNKYSQSAEKIVNGVEAVPHSWPWIARFQMDGHAGCAGSIINKVNLLFCFIHYLFLISQLQGLFFFIK